MARFDMKGDWDARAREDALFAIACDQGKDEAEFRNSAARDLRLLLEGLEPLPADWRSVLEIGCGVGRLLEPLADRFSHLCGVDISGEMVRQGMRRLSHLPQVQLAEVDGTGSLPFPDGAFDFCFSYITFHHIPQREVVRRYIAEVQRVLKPGGLFRFQLFGRPTGLVWWIREQFTKKSTWRGRKFTLPEIALATRQAGFDIMEARYLRPSGERRPRFFGKTPPHVIWVTARKPTAPDRQPS